MVRNLVRSGRGCQGYFAFVEKHAPLALTNLRVRPKMAAKSSMPLIFTSPLLEATTPELIRKIERAYSKFPELLDHRVTVGITKKRSLDGYAIAEDF